jgi:hypothetical protein
MWKAFSIRGLILLQGIVLVGAYPSLKNDLVSDGHQDEVLDMRKDILSLDVAQISHVGTGVLLASDSKSILNKRGPGGSKKQKVSLTAQQQRDKKKEDDEKKDKDKAKQSTLGKLFTKTASKSKLDFKDLCYGKYRIRDMLLTAVQDMDLSSKFPV